MRELKEHLSKEGVEFIQQTCKQEEDLIGEAVWTVKQLTPEEIEEFKAITPQQWVDMMRPLFSTPYFGDEMKDIFITEEAIQDILNWNTDIGSVFSNEVIKDEDAHLYKNLEEL